jgi:hypothetical protein
VICGLSGEVLSERNLFLARLGIPAVWGVLLAGLSDIILNISLIIFVLDGIIEPWPAIVA